MTKSEAYDVLVEEINDQNILDWIYRDDVNIRDTIIALASIVQTVNMVEKIIHRQEGIKESE